MSSEAKVADTNTPSTNNKPPITFNFTPLDLKKFAKAPAKDPKSQGTPPSDIISSTSTAVIFPLVDGTQKLTGSLNSGDVLVLGLKRKDSGASGASTGTSASGDSGKAKKEEDKSSCGGDDKKGDEKDSEKEKHKKLKTDFAPLGGTYEFAFEPMETETHDMVRVLGAIFRKSTEDKVLLQLLPEVFCHAKIYLREANDDVEDAKPKWKGRMHSLFSHDAKLKFNDGWGAIMEGYALNVSPNVNSVTDGGTDLKLEITFKSFHPHDVPTGFDKIKELFSGKSKSSANPAAQPASGDASASKDASKENEGKSSVDDKTEEIVSIGLHVVTSA